MVEDGLECCFSPTQRGDSKVQRIALEALYRLVWWVAAMLFISLWHCFHFMTFVLFRVYMVRVRGESNITTFK